MMRRRLSDDQRAVDHRARVNPFTDADFSVMLRDLNDLVRALHPKDPLYSDVTHNHHACIHVRDWLARLEAAPPIGAGSGANEADASGHIGPLGNSE